MLVLIDSFYNGAMNDHNETPLESSGALLDPALSPTRHEDRKARRRKRRRRVLGSMSLILVVLLLVYIVLIGRNIASISTNPSGLAGLTTDGAGRTNILILGQGDPGHDGAGLTDTMMVLSLNPATKQVAQISVPRDLRVNIDGYGYAKINSANADGGTALAEKTVSETLGIPINYYITTNFSGLQAIVDAVGGLDINVKTALIDTEYPCADNQYKVCGLNIAPGLQHMNGARVLEYTRCRKGTCGNDFGRAARQQEVLSLLRQKVVRWQTIANPFTVAPLTNALRTTLSTDMDGFQLAQMALDWQSAQKNNPINLVLSTGTGGYLISAGSTSDLIPVGGSFGSIQDRVQNIFTQPTRSTDVPK
jgi:LCP family protein required for cell wall assembly